MQPPRTLEITKPARCMNCGGSGVFKFVKNDDATVTIVSETCDCGEPNLYMAAREAVKMTNAELGAFRTVQKHRDSLLSINEKLTSDIRATSDSLMFSNMTCQSLDESSSAIIDKLKERIARARRNKSTLEVQLLEPIVAEAEDAIRRTQKSIKRLIENKKRMDEAKTDEERAAIREELSDFVEAEARNVPKGKPLPISAIMGGIGAAFNANF